MYSDSLALEEKLVVYIYVAKLQFTGKKKI